MGGPKVNLSYINYRLFSTFFFIVAVGYVVPIVPALGPAYLRCFKIGSTKASSLEVSLPAPTHMGEWVLVWELGVTVTLLHNEQGLIRITLSYDQGLVRYIHIYTGIEKFELVMFQPINNK
jgi:hypothetical protein